MENCVTILNLEIERNVTQGLSGCPRQVPLSPTPPPKKLKNENYEHGINYREFITRHSDF